FASAGDAADLGLAAEFALRADLAGHTRDFGCERAKLIDHRINGVLELQDFTFDIDGDLFREVTVGDRGGHFGNIADLRGQITGHEIDIVGKVLPGAGNAFDFGLAAQLALGADFARDTGDFGGERSKLVHDRANGVL